VSDDSEMLRGILYEKIALRKKRIHPEHSPRFNHGMQLEIDFYEWVLGKIEVNMIPFERLERIIRVTIKDLEKRKDKAMVRSDTDNLWTKIESLKPRFVYHICDSYTCFLSSPITMVIVFIVLQLLHLTPKSILFP
jgi:hypothetical protein